MPPLSEFDPEATLDGSIISIGGPMKPTRDADGREIDRGETALDVIFAVSQPGGGVARGRGTPENGRWSGNSDDGAQLRTGPARAFGMVVETSVVTASRGTPLVVFNTSTWSEEVRLVPPAAGA